MREQILLASLLALLLGACGDYVAPDSVFGPRWHLERPIYVTISDTMPKRDLVLAGIRGAISKMGGKLSPDPATEQQLHLLDTDGDRCGEPGVQAFTPLPADGRIFVCHSSTVLASYTPDQVTQIAMHELGHELSNRRGHLGGDPLPPACTSHAIMASNSVCRTGVEYTGEDLSYICDGRNVVGGRCATRAAL